MGFLCFFSLFLLFFHWIFALASTWVRSIHLSYLFFHYPTSTNVQKKFHDLITDVRCAAHKYQVGMGEVGVLLGSKRGQYLVCEMDLVSVDFEGEILSWEILVFQY